ncbi:MAG: GntR family transcriptional regulator [Clostridia bacterium]|nr:GntR family transcriptional regulator [Clostridia bacterium]
MADFKTVSLADQVFEKLENDIIVGVYPRGEILTELKLVEELGVSRTPIREALRRLEQERLIRESGKGSVVLGITSEDLIDIMEIRQRIEGLAAYYATVKLTPEGIEKLKHISELQEFYCERKDLENLRQMDDQFHDTICELSQSTVITDTLIPLRRKTIRYRKLSIENPERLTSSIQEHKDILNAIIARNADLASELMSRHIIHAKDNMIARFSKHE